MSKKNDKRLCWNCEGNVSHHLSQCPFCGADLTQPAPATASSPFKGYASPFQSAPSQQEIPKPPYARSAAQDFTVTDEEWNHALNQEEKEKIPTEENASPTTKKEFVALLLLLPGIVFFLFGLILVLFSSDGVLSLKWNQNVAYFYFFGAVPLLYLGWRALR